MAASPASQVRSRRATRGSGMLAGHRSRSFTASFSVTTTKSALLGFAYLFVFSLGMCTILVVVGLSTGAVAKLPRAGAWMLWVKRVFALLMFGVAEYYLLKAGELWI